LDYTVVVPVYNEARHLERLLPRLLPLVPRVLVVDDGSIDETVSVARRLGARVARHERNRGKGAAVQTGLRNAETEAVVLMDGDGQHDPRDAPRLARELARGYDLVIGDRFSGELNGTPLHRRTANDLIRWLLAPTGVNDPLSGLRALRRSRFLDLRESGYETEMEMVFRAHRAGLRIGSVPVRVGERVGSRALTDWLRPSGWTTYARLLSFAVRGRLG
jgi:glycosyltransferase involved in cell wall biosynthesis